MVFEESMFDLIVLDCNCVRGGECGGVKIV